MAEAYLYLAAFKLYCMRLPVSAEVDKTLGRPGRAVILGYAHKKSAVLSIKHVALIVSVRSKGEYLAVFEHYSIAGGIAKLVFLAVIAHGKLCVKQWLSVAVMKSVIALCIVNASAYAGILIEHNVGTVRTFFNAWVIYLV